MMKHFARIVPDCKQKLFTITDTGIPFDPTKVVDVDITLSAEERSVGGLGIFLVRQIMDTVEYQRIGNCNMLTLQKALNRKA